MIFSNLDFDLRLYVFPTKKTVFINTEKIGSSYLNSIINSDDDGYYYTLKYYDDKKEIDIIHSTQRELNVNKNKTEKQLLINKNGFLKDIDEYKTVILVRPPIDRCRTGLFQLLGLHELKNFYDLYDYFSKTTVGLSNKLIENALKYGLDQASTEDYYKYLNILVETLSFNFLRIFGDPILSTYHSDVCRLLMSNFFKNIIVLNLNNLDNFLLENNIIEFSNIQNHNKNAQSSFLNNPNRNFLKILKDIENLENSKNNKQYDCFKFYLNLYIKSETLFYDKLLKEYGEKE